MKYRTSALLLNGMVLLLLISVTAWAGGPNNPNGDGTFVSWDPTVPVKFTIDRGPLGPLSNADAAEIVREAARRWTAVATSRLSMQDNGFLSLDVTADNYSTFFGLDAGQQAQVRPENPIIFDSDGRLTDLILGNGANKRTLGFAGIRYYDTTSNHVLSAWAVLNGKEASLPNNPWRTSDRFPRTLLHELGHLLGLDHSQGIKENFAQPFFGPKVCGEANQICAELVPLMYPILDLFGTTTPVTDEVAWLSWMYPTANFASQTGTIRGRALRRSGGALQGANVVAVRAIDQGNGSYTTGRAGAVSVVSDFLMLGTGEYELPGLAPGKYFVYIEPLDTSFVEGSGVGPFDTRPTGFPRDFYSIPESSSDDITTKQLIEVAAGQTVSGIDIIANEVANNLKALGDDDEMLYVFPEGFHFPFFGQVYSELVVNSDGNLTFGAGDGKVGAARTESRFLSGLPRVAPLFTDLDPSKKVANDTVVKAETGDGFVRFIWQNVPEFSDTVAPPNYFSVTLYSTGDIVFDYTKLAITADPDTDYAQGLQAVVGVTPGGVASGTPQDLSSGNFPLGGSAIYEVFAGATLDLEGQQIVFSAASHALYFPYLKEAPGRFTGFAFSNAGTEVAGLTLEARAADGTLAPFPTNPAGRSVAAGRQLAELGRELFAVNPGETNEAWVRVLSSEPDLGSFFLYGDGLNELDGSVAQTEALPEFSFTRLYHGTGVYPSLAGWKDATTELTVVNPQETAITVTLKLYGPTGLQIGQSVVAPIEPLGYLRKTLGQLWGLTSETIRDGYVAVSVEGGGAIGAEVVQLNGTVFGLNGAPPATGTKLYSAQLGHGSGIFTSLKVVNPTTQAISVSIKGYVVGGGGTIEERVVAPFLLSPNQAFQRNVDQLFGFVGLPAEPIVGSIEVTSDPAGLVGDVVFGDPANAGFAAALPLESRLMTDALFSQVSNGVAPPGGNASLNAFTGLALFNPSGGKATVTIQVDDKDGVETGSTVVTLESRQRLSKLLSQLIPETAGQVRGRIVVTSDVPIVAQELFGNYALKYLAAVPPLIVQ